MLEATGLPTLHRECLPPLSYHNTWQRCFEEAADEHETAASDFTFLTSLLYEDSAEPLS
jgi:hypothetical protein